MELQVKPEGDSDAGNPYSSTSIDQYVSNIANTPLPSDGEKSLFYTSKMDDVQVTIELLDNSEKKNSTQRSAVRKYMDYLLDKQLEKEGDEVFKHNLYALLFLITSLKQSLGSLTWQHLWLRNIKI